jgi:hypothetical protein
VSLRSEFRVVMSVTISACKRCSVRFYLQLFVGALMSYLRYLCLLAYSGVINCVVFLLCFSSSCLPYVASLSENYPFVIDPAVFSNVYLLRICQ